MMTLETAVKAKVKKLLSKTPGMYFFMPVQNGMGAPTLDILGCYLGQYFAIETKAAGKLPTKRQEITISNMRNAGAKVFVIDGCTDELTMWLLKTLVKHGE